MTTAKPRLDNQAVNVSISKKALQLLKENGVTERKRGDKINELILKEYEKLIQPEPLT